MKNNWLVWGFKLSLILSLLSCTGSSSTSLNNENYGLDLNSCTANIQNEFVHRALQDRYYWYEQIADTVDYSAFNSPQLILDHLKYSRYDRFSYVEASETLDSFYNEGQYVGFGFAYRFDANNKPKLGYVYSDSPSGQAGLQRGDEIISVNGRAIANFFKIDTSGDLYLSGAFGTATEGIVRTIVFERNGIQFSRTLTKAIVTINTVLAAETFDYNNKKYAYLAFKSFINPSFDELSKAFTQFQSAGSQKLILDMRYNGGGLISVAAALASYIYQPQNNSTDKFVDLRFNDKYTSENYTYYFSQLSHSLNLNEVIILTTDGSCSASEMVINSLKPFINVTVIGSTTCGKPIGMRSQSFCGNDLVAINFQGFNHAGFGDYFTGISADCAANDEVTHSFGNINEPMLKAALDYDNQSTCIAPSARKTNNKQAKVKYHGLKQEIGAE